MESGIQQSRTVCAPSAHDAALRVIVAVHDNRAAVSPFIHALKLAFEARGELEIVDVRPMEERVNNIGVRKFLEKWQVLPECSKRGDVLEAGLRVQKVVRPGNKKKLLKKRIRQHPFDLLVIGLEEKQARAGIFGSSLATTMAEYFHRTTLLIPFDSRPFVDEETGAMALRRILVPVGEGRFYTRAMSALLRLVEISSVPELEVTGLHVGKAFPSIAIQNHEKIHWKTTVREGAVPQTIAAEAEAQCADLVIMATDGHDSISKTFTGSKTEQLMNLISCPVLAVAGD